MHSDMEPTDPYSAPVPHNAPRGVAVAPHIEYLQGLSATPKDTNNAVHFLAMMIKNLRQKVRTPMSTFLETVLPFIFVIGLVAIWAATSDGDTPTTSFTNASVPTTVIDGLAAGRSVLCTSPNLSYTNGPSIVSLPGIRQCNALELATSNCPLNVPRMPIQGLCVTADGFLATSVWATFRAIREVPSMDEMILWGWIARLSMTDETRGNFYGLSQTAVSNVAGLWFAPDTSATAGLIQYLNSTSAYFKYIQTRVFKSAGTARDTVATNEFADTAWAIVEIGKLDMNGIDVVLHLNRSGVPWTNQVTSFGNGIGSFSSGPYLASGFLTLQDIVNRYYSEKILNIAAPPPVVHIPMPFPGYSTSSFLVVIGTLAALFLVFGYIYPVSQLVKRIVEEKEQRVREAMMIMGLATAPFYCSWVLTYFIMQVVTSLICAGLLQGTMFPKSDFAIIWALYFTFGLSCITFSSMVSSFFSKSRIAALVAPVIFFVSAIPSFALPATTPAGTLVVISLLCPTAFANGMNVLVNQELSGGMTGASINQSFNGYPMSLAIFMLVLDTVLYMLITLYLDMILPSEWGTHEHPCFCFVNPYRWWKRRQQETTEEELEDGRDATGEFEATTPGLKPSVEMRGMKKIFEQEDGTVMTAVDRLTMNLYPNQIFALLGHNGAGKTTAMNLMTGMLEMDAGDCYFHGHSVRHDLGKVRREIGYCPQHNILWPELTCREHLQFFARLKGLDGEQRDAAVEAVLKAVDLEAKGDVFSTELSGGQKRKLSVAIAFVGGSSVVFLDEPTAGMDVEARRHTWDLIKHMSVGRTIVLTTHYMEEADLLGHNIAIMSKGKLKCSGSSVFLKSRLGVGYNLTATCDLSVPNTAHNVVQAVKQFVPDAVVLSDAAGEVSMRLPMTAVPMFAGLLKHFEDNGSALGVRGHGISVTTLEEIFLKLGHDEEIQAHAEKEAAAGSVAVPTTAAPQEEHQLMWTPEVASATPTFTGQAVALFAKRFHYAKRDTRTIIMQMVLPVVAILFAMLLLLIEFPDTPPLNFSPTLYSDASDSVYSNCAPNWNLYTANDTTSIDSGVKTASATSDYLLKNYKGHAINRIGAYVCGDTTNKVVIPFPPQGNSSMTFAGSYNSTTLFTNTSIYLHAAPGALREVHIPFQRQQTQRPIANSITSYPIPLSPRESGFINGIRSLFVALFVMIPFTFIPSTFVSFVVKERETHSLQLQQASGMRYVVYWFSNYFFDLASFFITASLVLIVFAIFDRSEYIGSAAIFFATFVLFILYGMAGVGSAYVMSFMFDSHSTAQNLVMLFNFICGFMLVLLAYIISALPSTKDAGDPIKFIFRIVPSYCLGEGILNLANNYFVGAFSVAPSVWDMTVVGWPMVYLAIETPLLMILTLYLDSPLRRSQQLALVRESDAPEPIQGEDVDVMQERQEIESGSRDATDVVVVKNLRKVYHTHKANVAVKNLSFGVHRGEVFGFLGTNGAGKTTTISILCGEHMPSNGVCTIGGYDVVGAADEVRKLIGYCPQFDATHDLLTVEEHIDLYCGLHGLTGPLGRQVAESVIHVCGLQGHREKASRNLSGGNRRKLSVAISLIGAPQVVFLDEPSAGMDPMARRGLFDVIEQVSRRCAVVLTTHHLEEVEALSHRVGIMVQGELRCVGPLQHLKNKFGAGFEMTLRVSHDNQVAAAIGFVTGNIPGAEIQEQRGTKLTVAMPQSTKLSHIFGLVESNKDTLHITDYSVSQTSLESVFLNIAEA